MIPESVLQNLQSWVIQVFVIASIGVALPLIFRIRHPRSQLVYCHLVIVACLVLPAVQPWQHSIIQVTTGYSTAPAAAATAPGQIGSPAREVSRRQIVVWTIMLGAFVRLCWTAFGLWRIRQYKQTASPIYPIPESITQAQTRTTASALFCSSSSGMGPVTFGFFRPIVLLPASFVSLEKEAQFGIACHELFHVRRKDWLMTLVEEIVAALFWFHPAFWWLLAQARLAREQIVDAEVVRVTAARESYINALLAMAGSRPALDLAPAPLFLRRRHLLQRMQLLVTEVPMSKFRLVWSYGLIVAILAAAGWIGVVSFPITGRAEIREVAAPPQNQPGYVVTIPPNGYPAEAAMKKIEGQVVVELTFNAAGLVTDSHVLSGPEELRHAALESALNRGYNINVARTLQVIVDFKLPAVLPPPPPPPPPPPNLTLPQGKILDRIQIFGVSNEQATNLQQRLGLAQGQPIPSEIRFSTIKNAAVASGIDSELLTINMSPTADNHFELRLVFGAGRGTQTPFGVVGGVIGQRGTPGSIQTPFGPADPGTIATPFGAQRVVGDSKSLSFVVEPRINGNLPPIGNVEVVYPPLAKQARVQGPVILEATLSLEGTVQNLRVIAGHPLLIQAAIDAVKQWKFGAQSADGTKTVVEVNFAITKNE
jgi:TonB family protein